MQHLHDLPTAPGALLGYWKDGRPFYVMAGGSGEGDGGGADGGTGGTGTTDEGTDTGTGTGTIDTGGQGSGDDGKTGDKPDKPADAGGDQAATISRLEKELKDARKDAGKERVTAKETAAAEARAAMVQELGKALGLIKDDKDAPPDPAKLTAEIERAQSAHRETAIELAVYKGADKHGASASKLADSRSFMTALAKLDPAADDFNTKVGKAIEKAVTDNPELKTTTAAAPPPRSGGEFAGGTGDKAPTDDIESLRKDRRERRGVGS